MMQNTASKIIHDGSTARSKTPKMLPASKFGSTRTREIQSTSGRFENGCCRCIFKKVFVIAPPRMVAFESGIAPCALKLPKYMKKGTRIAPPPMPTGAAMTVTRKQKKICIQSRHARGKALLWRHLLCSSAGDSSGVTQTDCTRFSAHSSVETHALHCESWQTRVAWHCHDSWHGDPSFS